MYIDKEKETESNNRSNIKSCGCLALLSKFFSKNGLANIDESFINSYGRKMELSSRKPTFRLVYPEAII